MLFRNNKNDFILINYRKVTDLITAEFLHDLYNQHDYTINPVRFRHTISVFENGIFSSYAPKYEWEMIRKYVGNKFLTCDNEFRENLLRYLSFDKKVFRNYLSDLENINLSEKSLEELGKLLIDLHFSALNNIYKVNLVQIEQGLFYALTERLKEKYGLDYKKYIAKYIDTGHSDVSEADNFLIFESMKISNNLITIEEAVSNYLSKYKDISYAYGDYSIDVDQIVRNKLQQLVNSNILEREQYLSDRNTSISNFDTDDIFLEDLRMFTKLVSEFRDQNKHLMGKVSFIRNKLLMKISKKTNISREFLSRCTLQEIYSLSLGEKIDINFEKVDEKYIFERKETVSIENGEFSFDKHQVGSQKLVHGIPVSKGKIVAKTIHYNPNLTVEEVKNKILVIQGTDFNVMDLILNSKGILVEEGGILSHASIVSREYGKPCVIGIQDLFKKIPNHVEVLLDGNEGEIHVL